MHKQKQSKNKKERLSKCRIAKTEWRHYLLDTVSISISLRLHTWFCGQKRDELSPTKRTETEKKRALVMDGEAMTTNFQLDVEAQAHYSVYVC